MKPIIIIPTYNEARSIAKLIEKIRGTVDLEILVVDDSSPDGTGNIIKSLSDNYKSLQLLIREKKEGLGKAYIHSISKVLNEGYTHVITMDGDMSHDPEYLPLMLDALDNADVVVGSRYIKGGSIQGWELWRRILSKMGNLYCRAVTRLPVKDCTSGFNIISSDFLKKINLNAIDNSGYAFLIELKYLLWKSGAKFKEIPIIFKNRFEGESKISNHIIKEGILAPWKMLLK